MCYDVNISSSVNGEEEVGTAITHPLYLCTHTLSVWCVERSQSLLLLVPTHLGPNNLHLLIIAAALLHDIILRDGHASIYFLMYGVQAPSRVPDSVIGSIV